MYDELIKALRNMSKMGMKYGIAVVRMREAADAIEELITKLNHADEQIEKLVEAAEERCWIPVTERLPEEREWVLCQCRAKIRMVLRLQNGYWHQDSQHEFMSGFVTHWMPLPTPPKGEEE